jgi:hemolysin III
MFMVREGSEQAAVTNANSTFSRAEVMADGAVHLAGIAASFIAVPVLLALTLPRLDFASGVSLAIYGGAIILLFCASAAYHLVPHLHWKPALRSFDQAAIFLKIAGTYTPLVVLIGSVFAYGVLAAVWVAAIAGALGKLLFRRQFDKVSVAIYLPLGWASLLLAWPIFQTLPLVASILIVAGGVLYTVGVLFHVREKLRFQNAIWHGFVLCASACHFAAVASASLASVA